MRTRYPGSSAVSRILWFLCLFWAGSLLPAQTLFEIRYEPASPSAPESSGDVQVNVVIDLVNSAPTAADNAYQYNADPSDEICSFFEPAPGVLANDTDPDGDPIFAVPINLPQNLTLNPDGSFTYGPTGCANITESFTYLATDGFFDSNVARVDIVINGIPYSVPSPDGQSYLAFTGQPLQLDGSNSFDVDGTIVSYEWDFGDGGTGTGSTPMHTYNMSGDYIVTLTVTDDLGAQGSETVGVSVLDPVPRTMSSSSGTTTGASQSVVRRSTSPATAGSKLAHLRRQSSMPGGAAALPTQAGRLAAARRPRTVGYGSRSGSSPALGGVVGLTSRSMASPAGSVCCSATYSALAGTATAGQDFIEVPRGTLNWTLDDSFPLQLSFTVRLLNDNLVEGDETIALTLQTTVPEVSVLTPTGTLTIIDDDALGTVQFRSAAFQIDEDQGTATILVDLTGNTSGPASVQYSAVAGTAQAGSDFEPTAGTLTWDTGIGGTQTFTVEILNDNLLEEDETVALSLSNPVGTTLGSQSNATLFIIDDDTPAGIQIESGDDQAGKVGASLAEPLVIRVNNDQGQPVVGATVNWEVTEGAGELLDGSDTVTDAEGLTSNRLELGRQLGTVEVTAMVPETNQSAVFSLSSELRLRELNLGSTQQPVAAVLDEICNGSNPGGMRSICDDLAELTDEDQAQAVRELTPDKIPAQADTAVLMMRTQYDNLVNRLIALRRERRTGLDDLALNLQGIQVPVEALAESLHFEQPQDVDFADQIARGIRGGGASADPVQEASAEEDALGKRLGFFLSGVLAVGDRPTVEQEAGVDLETTGVTVGVDYKFTDKVVWGGALGYMSTDGDLKRSGGRLDSSGYALSTYLLYLPGEAWYVDLVASYGNIDFENERVIDFPGNRQVARSDPQGDQGFFAVGGGYDLQKGSSILTLFGRGSYLDIGIDPYTENSAPGMQLSVDSQGLESLLATGGLEWVFNSSMSWGVLSPSVRLMYNHEFKDDLRFITASFADDPQGLTFAIATAEPDRDYLTAGLTLTATMQRGISAFLTFDNDFSRSDFDVYILTAGFRIELK